MITLSSMNNKIEFKQWVFPGGEVGVQLPEDLDKYSIYTVQMDFKDSSDIFVLMNVCNALEELNVLRQNIICEIPYFPYARQDRICSKGESFALRIVVEMLSNLYCSQIHVQDVHSEVTLRLFREYGIKYWNKPQDLCARFLPEFNFLIAPDKGAVEKAKLHKQVLHGDTELLFMSKERKDNQIIYTDYAYDTISGSVCVVDDLCDAGGTFLALGEMLQRTQPNITSLNLYVTHAIMGKGTQELKKFYSTIYIHNLMNPSVTDVTLV